MAVRADASAAVRRTAQPYGFCGIMYGVAERDRDIVFTHADVRAASLPPRVNEVGVCR